jgi:hypothetical protein
MNPKMPRPPIWGVGRAGTSKELSGTFDPQNSEKPDERQDSVAPVAQTQIVVGCRASFLYIRSCPLCGLEHVHGFFVHGNGSDPLAAFASHGDVRESHCHCHGPGRVARFVRGEWRTVVRNLPEWCEPEGSSYRLVLGPDPACFTPRAIKDATARRAMAAVARGGITTTHVIWTPRRSCFRGWGDR